MTAGVTSLLAQLSSSVPKARWQIAEAALVDLFEKALVERPNGRVFVLTGDIPAMWLRDSTWQMRPFLPLTNDAQTAELMCGVSRQQLDFLHIDPYANAFNPEPNGKAWHQDFPDQSPWVFERKFEVDSWAAVLDLPVSLWERTRDTAVIPDAFADALALILKLVRREQHHEWESYRFVRPGAPAHDHLSHDGYGAPFAPTGMVWGAFRPSDDACSLPFLIPSNAYLARALERSAALPEAVVPASLQKEAEVVARQIRSAIDEHGWTSNGFAYEVDGLGGVNLDDDANIPSLLSLPYLGFCAPNDERYLITRNRILSSANRWFYRGPLAEGIGSPHTPAQHVWPLAIAMAAITRPTGESVEDALEVLTATTGGTGRIHESFHVDDDAVFTRPWFSWAEMTYLHLLMRSAGLDV